MKKNINFVAPMRALAFLAMCLSPMGLWAQNKTAVATQSALEEFMFKDGKFNVVLAVIAVIVLGIIGYILYLNSQAKYYRSQIENAEE